MRDDWVQSIREIERLSPDSDLFERAQRGPTRPDQPPAPRPRVGAAALAVALAVVLVWGLVWVRGGRGTSQVASSPSASSPSASSTVTVYTDAQGWTMEIPSTWTSERADPSLYGSGGSGQEFRGDGLVLDIYTGTYITIPRDDSSLPLDAGTLLQPADGGWRGTFEFDGLLWTVALRTENGSSAQSPTQSDTISNMISSIAFPSWQPGQTRHGWSALFPTSNDNPSDRQAKISWQMCANVGCYVLAYRSNPPVLLGPIQTCGEGENMTADPSSPYPIVLECPNDPAQSWTINGQPAQTNMVGDDQQLAVHPVIMAWDGTLLTNPGDTIRSG